MLELNKVHNIDALIGIPRLDDQSIDCCITSPPYWGLRDYGLPDSEWPEIKYSPMPMLPEITVKAWIGVLGLEPTPEMFVGHIVHIFRGVYRALKDEGTLWLNFGDCYARSGGDRPRPDHSADKILSTRGKQAYSAATASPARKLSPGLKEKDLVGAPWRVAFALQADGWYLRSDIIWAKPNPMPESVTDRPTKAHEYLFLMSKSSKYWYDAEAIKEIATYPDGPNSAESIKSPYGQGFTRNAKKKIPTGWDAGNGDHRKLIGRYKKEIPEECRASASKRMGREPEWRKKDKQRGHGRRHAGFNDRWDEMSKAEQCSMRKNKRSVWTIGTQPFPDAHFAVYPEKLIIPCVLAGCRPGGTIFDPFDGAGTTRVVAAEYGRNCISFELNPEYIEISDKRYKAVTMQTKLDLMNY